MRTTHTPGPHDIAAHPVACSTVSDSCIEPMMSDSDAVVDDSASTTLDCTASSTATLTPLSATPLPSDPPAVTCSSPASSRSDGMLTVTRTPVSTNDSLPYMLRATTLIVSVDPPLLGACSTMPRASLAVEYSLTAVIDASSVGSLDDTSPSYTRNAYCSGAIASESSRHDVVDMLNRVTPATPALGLTVTTPPLGVGTVVTSALAAARVVSRAVEAVTVTVTRYRLRADSVYDGSTTCSCDGSVSSVMSELLSTMSMPSAMVVYAAMVHRAVMYEGRVALKSLLACDTAAARDSG